MVAPKLPLATLILPWDRIFFDTLIKYSFTLSPTSYCHLTDKSLITMYVYYLFTSFKVLFMSMWQWKGMMWNVQIPKMPLSHPKGPPQLKKSLKFQLLAEIFWTPSPLFEKGPYGQKFWYFVPNSNYKVSKFQTPLPYFQKPNLTAFTNWGCPNLQISYTLPSTQSVLHLNTFAIFQGFFFQLK